MKNDPNFCNYKNHENWSRRDFIHALGLVGAGSLTLGNSSLIFSNNSKLSAAIQNAESDRILIIVRLFGGNDGLNTIIPLNQYDLYANARPSIKLNSSEVWKLSDDYAMPNFMNSFENLWGDGKMKIVHSVGYEDHNQSHFKGSDIWSTAKTDTSEETGWIGRYFEDLYPNFNSSPPTSPTAIQIGATKNFTFNGLNANYSFSVSNISKLTSITNTGLLYNIDNLPDCTHGDKLKFMRAMTNNTYDYANLIYQSYNNSTDYTDGNGYEDNDFANSLNIISRLIKGNLGTKIFMLTLSGFDTHSQQKDTHQDLLTTLSNSIDYFYKDLTNAGFGDKVLTMTISEFGRRVSENGSEGTDHGTACPLMFFGEGLNGSGFVGEHASLETDQLINNFRDLQYNTDFRSVYATVLKDWLCVDVNTVNDIVLQGNFETLDLGLQCNSNTSEEIQEDIIVTNNEVLQPNLETESLPFNVYSFYTNNENYLAIQSDMTQHMTIKLYDLNSKYLGLVANKVFTEGEHQINIKSTLNLNLSRGYYIFTLVSNSNFTRRKIMIF